MSTLIDRLPSVRPPTEPAPEENPKEWPHCVSQAIIEWIEFIRTNPDLSDDMQQ